MSMVKSRSARTTTVPDDNRAITLDEKTRDLILNDIITSLAKNGAKSVLQTTAETKTIADKRNVMPMQVAGVRAALTRGTYGKKTTLVNARKKELNSKTASVR